MLRRDVVRVGQVFCLNLHRSRLGFFEERRAPVPHLLLPTPSLPSRVCLPADPAEVLAECCGHATVRVSTSRSGRRVGVSTRCKALQLSSFSVFSSESAWPGRQYCGACVVGGRGTLRTLQAHACARARAHAHTRRQVDCIRADRFGLRVFFCGWDMDFVGKYGLDSQSPARGRISHTVAQWWLRRVHTYTHLDHGACSTSDAPTDTISTLPHALSSMCHMQPWVRSGAGTDIVNVHRHGARQSVSDGSC